MENGGEVFMERSAIPSLISKEPKLEPESEPELDSHNFSDAEKENVRVDIVENVNSLMDMSSEDMINMFDTEFEADVPVDKPVLVNQTVESESPESQNQNQLPSSSPSMEVDLESSKPSEPTPALESAHETSTNQVSEAAKKFAEQEAALNWYIEEAEKIQQEEEARKKALIAAASAPVLVPSSTNSSGIVSDGKPKRRSIAELLRNLPGNLLNKKPVIRHTTKQMIDFDEDFKASNNTKKKGIEDLMARFDIHTAVNKPSKQETFKIHITKKEEDSQGITHIQTDEAEYVKIIPDEEMEELTSPQAQAPGVKMGQVKAKLMSEIRANRAKAYEEKMKVHAMYNEEKELEEKENEEVEEVLLDEFTDDDEDDEDGDGDDIDGKKIQRKKKKKAKKSTKNAQDENEEEDEDNEDEDDEDSELDEEQEEDLETLLDGNEDPKKKRPKKSRKRLVFLEEEADESDEGAGDRLSNDEDEDRLDRERKDDADFIDDRPISSDEDTDEDEDKVKDKLGKNKISTDAIISQEFELETQTQSQNQTRLENKVVESQLESCASQDLFSEFEKDINSQRSSQSTPKHLNPLHSFLDPNKTPVICASILSNRGGPSPLGPWNSISSNPDINTSSIRHPGGHISPLIPRLNSDAAIEAFYQDHLKNNGNGQTDSKSRKQSPVIPVEVAKLVGTQPLIPTSQSVLDDDLEAICSARFPSQPLQTPLESQEFDCFGFEEDLDAEDSQTPKPTQHQNQTHPTTPAPANSSCNASTSETPKTTTMDRAPRNTRLNFNISSTDMDLLSSGLTTEPPKLILDSAKDTDSMDTDDDDDDEGSVIGIVIGAKSQRKRKRLQFSDDEDDDEEKEKANPSGDEEDGDDDEEDDGNDNTEDSEKEDEDSELEVMYDENEKEIPKPSKFKGMVSRKTGMLRKEFVEGEAELSGSEEGSDDEDERGLDEFEVDEVADREEFDEDQVRDQNAKVFNKLELDEDQRDIRDFENRFLEHGDLHTDGKERERKFKWSNMDESKLDCYKDDDVEEDVEEDEVEKQQRKEYKEKMRTLHGEGDGILQTIEDEASQKILEDSQFLKFSGKSSRKSSSLKIKSNLSTSNLNDSGNTSLEKNGKSKSFIATGTLNVSRTTVISSSTSLSSSTLNAHSIIPDTSPRTTFQRKGSFLLRETTITRQAEMFKMSESTTGLKSGKSFVFAVVTPPTEVEGNRKSRDSNGQNPNKKQNSVSQPKKMIKTELSSSSSSQTSSIFKWI